jgi:ribosomal protein S18 acetylase RimI-like enzyme
MDQYSSCADIDSIFAFSTEQFQQCLNDAKSSDASSGRNNPVCLDDWKRLLKESRGKIYYMKSEDSLEFAGFLFTYRKPASVHIWLALTHKAYRRCGVMSSLFAYLQNELISERDVDTISVNTIPSVFISMPDFLIKQGFQDVTPLELQISSQKRRFIKKIQEHNDL